MLKIKLQYYVNKITILYKQNISTLTFFKRFYRHLHKFIQKYKSTYLVSFNFIHFLIKHPTK